LSRRQGPDRRTRQKPSRRWQRTQKRLGRAHARVANLRRDGLHKLTSRLAATYGTVVAEDLNVAGMLRNRRLARHIADAGFAELRRQLTYKTDWGGGRLVVADRWYPSSKTCSACGTVKTKLALSERVYNCQSCGLVLDRDLNAARNLAALAAETTNRREWPGGRTRSRPEDPARGAGGCETSTRHHHGGQDRDRPTARRDYLSHAHQSAVKGNSGGTPRSVIKIGT
jgi:putative transposase